jgi:alpha-ketoglutaric semialdehyde dehydrogenase
MFKVVHGKGRVVGNAPARDPRIAGLSFTGSTNVGLGLQEILNARRARVQLEMAARTASWSSTTPIRASPPRRSPPARSV